MQFDLHRNATATWCAAPSRYPERRSKRWMACARRFAAGDTLSSRGTAAGGNTEHRSARLCPPPFSQVKDKSDTLSTGHPFGLEYGRHRMERLHRAARHQRRRPTHRERHARSAPHIGTTEDHPLVRHLQLMIQSSRYITSRKEYERMVNASIQAALDAFWLSCGNEKSISYVDCDVLRSRRKPTGTSPGASWRTDRGMVHIVLGFPTKYAEGRTANGGFTGKKVGQCPRIPLSARRTPVGQRVLCLSRSIQFRSRGRMVTNWRNGRIKAD